ncbi:alpha/beta hydrolase [Paenibacillus sp. CAU 1782]
MADNRAESMTEAVENSKTSWPRLMIAWLKDRFAKRLDREGFLSRFATGSLALFGAVAMSLQVSGIPTGLGTIPDQLIFLTMAALLGCAACYVLTLLFSMVYLPLPRRLSSLFVLIGAETYLMLHYAEFGWKVSLVLSLSYAVLGLASGFLLGILVKSGLRSWIKLGAAAVTGVLAALLLNAFLWAGPEEWPERFPKEALLETMELDVADPSQSGQFEVDFFSYGSGSDRHRELFGDDSSYETAPVNASSYIKEWPWLRSLFWGFDQKNLPLNGRVWMPAEEGTYPLALIVHGNHLMEDFSDDGYGYLGELLASKGIIAVSVDANFLNFSVWSGIPEEDMKVRAWLLLKHLQVIHNLDESGATAFSDSVDWSNVALIGHSRGGQAAAMAADWPRWFDEDSELQGLEEMDITTVVAIAPVDRAVDDEYAELRDVNYLTIQGAKDADVNNFYGDRQYNRVTFSGSKERFKASLYIENANHSQFNTSWGRMDERLPGGLFLNSRNLLSQGEQQKIAQVYVSSFLEATLQGNESYKGLFQDYRSGEQWLPDTTRYLSRYEGADFVEVTRFQDHAPLVEATSSSDVTVIEDESVRDRDGNVKGTTGLVLEWEEPGATFEIQLSEEAERQLEQLDGGSLVFAVSNLEWDLIAPGLEESELIADERSAANDSGHAGDRVDSAEAEDDVLPPLPVVEVVLTERSGGELTLLLDDIAPIDPPAYTSFLSMSWLEGEIKNRKYGKPVEEVLRTVVAPISLFGDTQGGEQDRSALSPSDIKSITFRFLSGPGKIRIDEIGFLPEGGSYVQYNS